MIGDEQRKSVGGRDVMKITVKNVEYEKNTFDGALSLSLRVARRAAISVINRSRIWYPGGDRWSSWKKKSP